MRELRTVPNELLSEVLDKAAEIAGDGRLTAKVLKEAREQVLEPEKPEEPTAEEPVREESEPELEPESEPEPKPDPEPTRTLQCVW